MACTEIVKADDCVECFFFPLDDTGSDPDKLEALRAGIENFVKRTARNHIWHKDDIKFQKRYRNAGVSLLESEPDLPSHVYGVCQFGDNVEDEWFVVFLANEVSKEFPNVTSRVIDSDGEFLLIEAANSLPSWADPKNTDNRVFFHGGSLLFIPPKDNDGDEEITIEEALDEIKNSRSRCLASNEIVEDVFRRIEGYPDKINESFHTVTAFVPVGVAALLKEDRNLISAAVHAFCNRDPIDMKACRAMRYFPPETRINASVTFTKCLYAMLVHNDFHPDRRTGWNLPLPNAPQYKSHSIGVKLACGFEILVSQAKTPDDFTSCKAWENYLINLKKRGYFKDLLENSKPYNDLLENAKEYYINNLQSVKSTPILGTRILNLLGSINTDVQSFKKNEPNLPKDDDDSWLYIDPKELETLLQKRYGRKDFFSMNSEMATSQFSSKVNEFLEHMSGVDGAEFPNQTTNGENEGSSSMPVRPKRGIKPKKNKMTEYSSNQSGSRSPNLTRKYKNEFDADQFSSAIQNILDLVIPEDKWNSDSDLSEYGSDDGIGGNIFVLPHKGTQKQNNTSLKEYMEKMDTELAATSIGKSFEKTKSGEKVDIDKNSFVNFKESYSGECGGTGPAGNLLGPLGFTKMEEMDSIDEETD